VAVGGDEHHGAVAEDVVLAVHGLVAQGVLVVRHAGPVPPLGQDLGRARGLHLPVLHEDRRVREELVAAAVVEMPVRVGDVGHLRRRQAEPAELADDVVARLGVDPEAPGALLAVAAEHVRQGVAVQPGVEEQATTRMRDQEALDRHRPP
jgi:hypothetical protein